MNNAVLTLEDLKSLMNHTLVTPELSLWLQEFELKTIKEKIAILANARKQFNAKHQNYDGEKLKIVDSKIYKIEGSNITAWSWELGQRQCSRI